MCFPKAPAMPPVTPTPITPALPTPPTIQSVDTGEDMRARERARRRAAQAMSTRQTLLSGDYRQGGKTLLGQ